MAMTFDLLLMPFIQGLSMLLVINVVFMKQMQVAIPSLPNTQLKRQLVKRIVPRVKAHGPDTPKGLDALNQSGGFGT